MPDNPKEKDLRFRGRLSEVFRLMEEGQVPQNALGLSEEWMSEQYEVGYVHFCDERYREAATVFSHLAALNPGVKTYWLALAVAQIRSEAFEMALTSLAMATILDPKDPEPHYYAGLCHVRLECLGSAASSFKIAMKLMDDDTRSELFEDIKEWLDNLGSRNERN